MRTLSSPRRISDSVSSARACCAVIARVVTVLRDSAAVFLALRLSMVEMTSAVPTQINMISTAIPPATNPMLTRRRVRRASQRLANDAEQQRRQHHQDDRRGNAGRRGGLGVDPRRGLLVEPLCIGQDRLLHQRRRLGQVRRADRVARPVVGARGLDQPGVHRELGVDAAEQLDHRLIGQPARRPGDRDGGVGDGLFVALPDVTGLCAGDEGRRRGGVGDRQRGVELSGGECQRLGVVEDCGQRLLAIVDGRRRGERAGDHQRGQHEADGQDAAGRRPQEPPAWMRGGGRRPRRKRLGRRVRQLHSHVCADLIYISGLPAIVLDYSDSIKEF